MLKTVRKVMFNLLIVYVAFSCSRNHETIQSSTKIKCNFFEFTLADTSLYNFIKKDIDNYRGEHFESFQKESYFLLYKDLEDSTIVCLTPRRLFPCSSDVVGVFYVDSIACGIYGHFREGTFVFKGINEIEISKPEISKKDAEGTKESFVIDDPFIWIYVDTNQRYISPFSAMY